MTSRAQAPSAYVVSSVPWGDRTRLLPKATLYVFSLDVVVQGDGPYLSLAGGEQPNTGLRHLFSHRVVQVPGGQHCEVPTGTAFAANGEVGEADDPTSNWFNLRVQAGIGELEAKSGVPTYATTVTFSCTGVLDIAGGPAAYRRSTGDVSGSAFMTSIQESTTPSYRWLERRQLFGIGLVKSLGPASATTAQVTNQRKLHFSFDLYAAD
jgi:hypothetical protein